MSSFYYDENDSMGEGLSKGLLTGALGLAGIYGLNELKNFLMDKLHITPRVYPKDVNLKFNIKQSSLVKQAVNLNIPAGITYGMGLPLGAFGTYKFLRYLSDKMHQYQMQSDIRRFDKAVEYSVKNDAEGAGNPFLEESPLNIHKASLKEASLKEALMRDPEIDEFLEKNVFSKQAGQTPTMGDVAEFLGVTIPTQYLPVAVGALMPMGALAGYYGMERLMRNKSTVQDPGKPPRLVYRLEKDPKKSDDPIPQGDFFEKDSEELLDKALGFASRALKSEFDKSELGSAIGKVTKAVPQLENLLNTYNEFSERPLESLMGNPKLVGGIMGLGTMATLPGTMANYFSNKNLGSKLDQIISKMDTKTSIADTFKLSNTQGIRT